MKFEYLSKEERDVLRKVKTTPEQAEQIKRRNRPMLDLVRSWIEALTDNYAEEIDLPYSYSNNVGCPHCINVNAECNRCAWKHAGILLSPWGTYCCDVKFGGISCRQCFVMYGVDFEAMHYLDERSLVDFQRAEKFLAGHAEWANWVLSGYEDD